MKIIANLNYVEIQGHRREGDMKGYGSHDDCENIVNSTKPKEKAASVPANGLKSCSSGDKKGTSAGQYLSTRGETSSNGTEEKKSSKPNKVKSESHSNDSNDRDTEQKIQKDMIDSNLQTLQKTMFKNFDSSKQPEIGQKISGNNDHSRNLYQQQNNHHRYRHFNSGQRDAEEIPGNYLAKTSEKLKIQQNKGERIKSNEKLEPAMNTNNIKIFFKNTNKSRGRSNKSGPLSNRNSSGEVAHSGIRNPQGQPIKMKKNPHQTIKLGKKKIQIKRSSSQTQNRPKSLSNQGKLSTSKKSDDSTKADTKPPPQVFATPGMTLEQSNKNSALATISKFNQTTSTQDNLKNEIYEKEANYGKFVNW